MAGWRRFFALATFTWLIVAAAAGAQARVVTVRWSHPDAATVQGFRIYVRPASQAGYGSPAYDGKPAPQSGVYQVSLNVSDTETVHATGKAYSAAGESALSNEISFAAPAPVCGNGTREGAEACDDGNALAGDGCRADCTIELCGDGRRDPAETCDDGNTVSGDGCRSTCRVEVCGDGIRDPLETCDDGNTVSGDGCSALCAVEPAPRCGDGRRDTGEGCDDGNTSSGDGCSATCTVEPAPRCGDGRRDTGEGCDDGNTSSGDGCSATCTVEAPRCGDGRLDSGETCDDGNAVSGDGCSATCSPEGGLVCGDGRVGPGEACDDGNTVAGDGCDASCTLERPSQPALPLRLDAASATASAVQGTTWLGDGFFANGGTAINSTGVAIAATTLDPLYWSRRFGPTRGEPLTYEIPVAGHGPYRVRLHFAEFGMGSDQPGQRVFDVFVEDAFVIEDIDVARAVGSRKAMVREFQVLVGDGSLTLRFVGNIGAPMISAIEVAVAQGSAVRPKICSKGNSSSCR
jgi:cysteine-rich repeat protein